MILKGEELAKKVGTFYYVLILLYHDKKLKIGDIAIILKKRPNNVSALITKLEGFGLVQTWNEERTGGRAFKYVRLSDPVRNILKTMIEVKENKEKPWLPQSREVKFCIEVLKKKGSKETHIAFLTELGSILSSGYWDEQLKEFFIDALDDPERYEGEIEKLLRAQPRNTKMIELFCKTKRNKIYDLVKSSGRLSSLALRKFIDVSKEREALDKMEEGLKGEEAERVLSAAKDYGQNLYKKFGLDFKMFLHMALEHESEAIRESALELMKEIFSSSH